MDTSEIRERLKSMGWRTLELPVRKTESDGSLTVVRWKLLGAKGDRSIEVGGLTLEEAMTNLGVSLGAIPRETIGK